MTQEFVECWFIGDFLNNRLLPVDRLYFETGRSLVVVDDLPYEFWTSGFFEQELARDLKGCRAVTYARSEPLQTGVPVYSCFNLVYSRHHVGSIRPL
jgi:hypothetical protein